MKLFRRKKSELDEVMELITKKMLELDPSTKEYTTMAVNLETLSKAKANEKERGINLNSLFLGGVNLIGIVLVLKHEKIDIITSKAFNWILKWRV